MIHFPLVFRDCRSDPSHGFVLQVSYTAMLFAYRLIQVRKIHILICASDLQELTALNSRAPKSVFTGTERTLVKLSNATSQFHGSTRSVCSTNRAFQYLTYIRFISHNKTLLTTRRDNFDCSFSTPWESDSYQSINQSAVRSGNDGQRC